MWHRVYARAMRTRRALFCLLIFLALPRATTAPKSARDFVQKFYNWYVAKGDDALRISLKQRSADLTPELARALKEDQAAQDKVEGEIVGLDFDPFLNSQDPCPRYETGAVNGSRIDIHSVCEGRKSRRPDATVEVVSKNGRWLIANIHYPEGGGDLLSILKQLRQDRR